MGSLIIQDISQLLHKETHDVIYKSIIPYWEWPKREPPDLFLHSYQEVILQEVTRHVEAIEAYLERDVASGKAFVRPQERPAVGAEALNQVMETVRLLERRIADIEQKSGSGRDTVS